jgi:hypothetical protein
MGLRLGLIFGLLWVISFSATWCITYAGFKAKLPFFRARTTRGYRFLRPYAKGAGHLGGSQLNERVKTHRTPIDRSTTVREVVSHYDKSNRLRFTG